ncbi:hypothetical protein JL720_4979 [Aureococcus anophagefferens]|nr:hypothetical protein JL720_4979 [Aureococcus anophagefferens]
MTYFLQLLAIICRFNYANAPANLGYYEILLDVALFDIDILKPSCVIGWTFTRSVVAQFGVVVVGFVVNFGPIVYDVARDVCAGRLRPCGVYASLHYYDGPYGPRATRAAASVLALIDVQQTTIAFNAFASFRCDAFEGYDAKFLREQPDESCDGPNAAFLIILGLSTTVVFTLGLPHLLLGSIEYECEANGGVHHSHVQDLLGWNFGAFRAPHHGWRIRRIYLSVVICLAATMFDDPLLQIAIALAAVFQTYADHLRNEPYIEPRLNRLETMGLQLVVHFAACSQSAICEGVRRGARRGAEKEIKVALVQLADEGRFREAQPEAHTLRGSLASMGATVRRSLAAVGSSALHPEEMLRSLTSLALSPRGPRRDSETQSALEAAGEISNSFHPLAWRAWVDASRRDADAVAAMARVAKKCRVILSDVSCTSVYSADHRSMYWNSVSRSFPGIIDFVATLHHTERTSFFGVMCKLQRYVEQCSTDPIKRHVYDLVSIALLPRSLHVGEEKAEKRKGCFGALLHALYRSDCEDETSKQQSEYFARIEELAIHANDAILAKGKSGLRARDGKKKRSKSRKADLVSVSDEEDVASRIAIPTVEGRAWEASLALELERDDETRAQTENADFCSLNCVFTGGDDAPPQIRSYEGKA